MAIVAVVYLASTPLLTALGGLLIEDDGLRKADAILVLGGDRYGDRTLKAGQLAKDGYAPIVFVSGPPRLIGYESDDEIQFAETKGYSASLFKPIHLPEEAESTRTEARFVGQVLRDQGIKSILLVTSNFHTKRGAKLFRQENPTLSVTVIPSTDRYFTPSTWWKTRPGEKTFIYEWMKTISVELGI